MVLCVLLPVARLGFAQTPPPGASRISSSPGDSRSGPEFTVRVYNYAQVPPDLLAKAENEATCIFAHSGLAVRWEGCTLVVEEERLVPRCGNFPAPTELAIEILPQKMWAKLHHRNPNALGFAAVAEEGERSFLAYISWPEVEETARRWGLIEEEDILGSAIAHEVGHLLLRTCRHAPEGIMRAKWRWHEARLASEGNLLFARWQAKLLRAEVLARASSAQNSPPRLAALGAAK